MIPDFPAGYFMRISTTEAQRRRESEDGKDARTSPIIGAAIEVHRHLGPGLLESAYEECLCHELHLRRLELKRQVDLPVLHKGIKLDCGYKLDVVVQDTVVLELKVVDRLHPNPRSAASDLPAHDGQTCRPAYQFQRSLADSGHNPDGSLSDLGFLCASVSLW